MFYKSYYDLVEAMKSAGNLALSAYISPKKNMKLKPMFFNIKTSLEFLFEDEFLKLDVNDDGEIVFGFEIDKYGIDQLSGAETIRMFELLEFEHVTVYPSTLIAWIFYRRGIQPDQDLLDKDQDLKKAYHGLSDYMSELYSITDEHYELFMADSLQRSN